MKPPSYQSKSMDVFKRILLLFSLGWIGAVLVDFLLQTSLLTNYPHKPSSIHTETWVSFSCGFTACFVGLVYPLLDELLDISIKTGWTKVLRCFGAFIGLNYAISVFVGFIFRNSQELTIIYG
jgi:Insulin-induced protein (INSIG)